MEQSKDLPIHFQPASLFQDKAWLNYGTGDGSTWWYHVIQKDGKEVGHALVQKRKIRFTPFVSLRVTFGPVTDYSKVELRELVANQMKLLCVREGAVFIEVHPYTNVETESMRATFNKHGFQRIKNYIFESTIVLDLNKSEEDLFRNFEQRGKEAVRQSVRRGILSGEVEMSKENLNIFYSMYSDTCRRSGMVAEPASHVLSTVEYFGKMKMAFLFFAKFENKPVCAFVAYRCGDCLSLIYQGSDYSNDYQNKRPANNLYWETMKWAKQNGFRWFDLAGITVNTDPESKKTGIKNFKLQFGGNLIHFPGNFRYVHRPIIFALYNMILPLYSVFSLFRMRTAKN